MRYLIQIYLADEKTRTYNVWIVAWEDRGEYRYAKDLSLMRDAPIAEIDAALPVLLDRGRELLESWTSESLERTVRLGPTP